MYYRLIILSVEQTSMTSDGATAIIASEGARTYDFIGFKTMQVGLAAFNLLLEISAKDYMTYKWSEGRDANDSSLDRPQGPITTFHADPSGFVMVS